jgi:hypothetical protein
MSQASDAWYVRFPDGRVMHANSTAAVRHHLESGRIPTESRVRRAPDEEWTALDWAPEFSDLVPKRPVRTGSARAPAPRESALPVQDGGGATFRVSALQLQSVGLRGLAEELLSAMDSTLVRSKLVIAGLVGIVGAGVIAGADLVPSPPELSWLPWLAPALLLAVFGAIGSALLTQMTFVEVSRLRPARWSEATAGLRRQGVRLLVAQLLVGGSAVAAIVLLRRLPAWLLGPDAPEALTGADVLAGVVTAVALVVQVLLWPVPGFALLLAPLILIEECSVVRALRLWWGLVRGRPSRIFLYEALAIALGSIAAVPFVLPVALAWASAPAIGLAGTIAQATLALLTGLALTPLIAYLIVANVFIYLNLRYEHWPQAR